MIVYLGKDFSNGIWKCIAIYTRSKTGRTKPVDSRIKSGGGSNVTRWQHNRYMTQLTDALTDNSLFHASRQPPKGTA